ncbi:MAG TPA: DUF1501 domain-containing protein [Kineosporiaceae bacterium]
MRTPTFRPLSRQAPPHGHQGGHRLELSRRGVLTALGGSALLTAVLGEVELAFAAPDHAAAGNVLVTIRLSGGIDGLSVIAPIGDPDYAPNRPTIAVRESSAIQVDSRFALHPALAPVFPLWTAGRLAAVHAVGQPSPSRSHAVAAADLDRAAPDTSIRTGWLDRTLAVLPAGDVLEGVSLGRPGVPGLLRGPQPVLSAAKLDDVTLPVDTAATPAALWQRALAQLHTGAPGDIGGPMATALAAVGQIAQTLPPGTGAVGGPLYPSGGFGQGLRDVAQLVKARAGLRVATVELAGWDIHANHGSVDGGRFAPNLKTLADGLAAFAQDLGPELDRVTVVTLTEFGRRARQNGNNGLDHGRGSVMLLLGGGVNGGKVHGLWPGLSTADLDGGQDLAVTTDYRAVLAEALTARMGLGSVADIFPGYRREPVGAISR